MSPKKSFLISSRRGKYHTLKFLARINCIFGLENKRFKPSQSAPNSMYRRKFVSGIYKLAESVLDDSATMKQTTKNINN